MLVLARRTGQSITINGGEIVVTVIEIRPGLVRLGVVAPQQISIHRAEIEQRILDGIPHEKFTKGKGEQQQVHQEEE